MSLWQVRSSVRRHGREVFPAKICTVRRTTRIKAHAWISYHVGTGVRVRHKRYTVLLHSDYCVIGRANGRCFEHIAVRHASKGGRLIEVREIALITVPLHDHTRIDTRQDIDLVGLDLVREDLTAEVNLDLGRATRPALECSAGYCLVAAISPDETRHGIIRP